MAFRFEGCRCCLAGSEVLELASFRAGERAVEENDLFPCAVLLPDTHVHLVLVKQSHCMPQYCNLVCLVEAISGCAASPAQPMVFVSPPKASIHRFTALCASRTKRYVMCKAPGMPT